MTIHRVLLVLALALLTACTYAASDLPAAIRQTQCPTRCRTNRNRTRRSCRRNGCRIGRCFTGVGIDQPLIRGFTCRERINPAPAPQPQPVPAPPPPPAVPQNPIVVPPPMDAGPVAVEGTTGTVLRCSVDTQPAIGIRTTVAGVTGVLIFRTFSPEFVADRNREETCLSNGMLGFSVPDIIQILGGCVPQTTCTVTARRCNCSLQTMFCFRELLNNAFSRNCPATTPL